MVFRFLQPLFLAKFFELVPVNGTQFAPYRLSSFVD
jgi:hypothetical protein